MDTRCLGRKGEDAAANYIVSQGGIILTRNFFFKGGEIDIVAKDRFFNEDYICFIEVKARNSDKNGYPEEAVTLSKQKKIIRGALFYLNYKKIGTNVPIRFDVISILDNEVKWIKNAFTM